ncbi:MAG: sulfotransferase domain-containing protein [Methylohalobius sp. ZOD2]
MKKPNFFIIGAPKCGTTSLASWLSTHPQVFMCSIKEPHFFNWDYAVRRTKTLASYENLFSGAAREHVAIGEASVRYLYSRVAVPAICCYVERPRFIVMIRDPVEMAYSLHDQTVFNGFETENDFERAWRLQHRRMYGDSVPYRCPDMQLLQYGTLCRIGEQLQRLYKYVAFDQVIVLRMENLKSSPRSTYLKVLEFLGLEDDGRVEFPVLNVAKEARFRVIRRSVSSINQALARIGVHDIRLGISKWLDENGRRSRPRPPLANDLENELRAYFLKDTCLLENLTGLDLFAWKGKSCSSDSSESRYAAPSRNFGESGLKA